MAIAFVENTVAVSYHGIIVYHVHKDNLIEQPTREYWFTLEPFGSENDESTFDIREQTGYDASKTAAANLVSMIFTGIFGETNLLERESTNLDDPYPAEATHPEQCPVCGAQITEYGDQEISDIQVGYSFTCPNCGVQGFEWGKIEFDGYTIS